MSGISKYGLLLFLALLLSPALIMTQVQAAPVQHLDMFTPSMTSPLLLDPTFDPQTTGGVPFCISGSLGTIICYPPNFLKVAYNFPSTTGKQGLDGSGSAVVIVDAFGSPTIQSDLNTYDTAFGLPAATITIVCGPTWTGSATDNCPVKTISDLSTAPNAALCGAVGWAEETTLDVTQVHGLAPGANIVLVVANDCLDTSLTAAEAAVVAQPQYKGSIMSQSFGEPDDSVGCSTLPCTGLAFDPTIRANQDAVYLQATLKHWTIIASSGDDGANTNLRYFGTTELTPSWPATNPLNLGAGGTQGSPYGGQYGTFPGHGGTFTCAAGATCNTGLVVVNGGADGCTTATRPGEPSSCIPVGYGGESTWNEYLAFLPHGGVGAAVGRSSGGGASTFYSRPFYQFGLPTTFTTLLGTPVSTTGRLSPDVSFNSAAHGGVLAYLGFLGAWAVFSGTSASAPAWAAIIALLNQKVGVPVGFVTPAIYLLARIPFLYHAVFHDITSGENSDTAGQFGVDGYTGNPGYDLTTGWGTPNVSNLINILSQLYQNSQGNQNN